MFLAYCMDISIVIPVYNEEPNVWHLYKELKGVLDRLRKDYEIIFVDDGSTDCTFTRLIEISKKDKRLKAIQLTKNFQKAAALMAGFREASGDIIITLDGDLQDDPNEIPKLLQEIKNCDLVVGWRYNRVDSIAKKIPSYIFNVLIRIVTGIKLHDSDCNLRAMKGYILKDLNIYGGLYRYIPIMVSNIGYKVREVKVNHRIRLYGKSKYNFKRFFGGVLDLITIKFLMSYTKKPLHLFGFFGFVSSCLGFLLGLYLLVVKYLQGQEIGNRPLLFLAVLLIVVGIQFFSIGLIGEQITNYNYKAGSQYAIKRKV